MTPKQAELVKALQRIAYAITASEEDTLVTLFKKHKLKEEDLGDLFEYVEFCGAPTSKDDKSPKDLTDSFKVWWGNSVPKYWNLPESEFAEVVYSASALHNKVQSGAKTSSVRVALLAYAVIAAASHAAKKKHDSYKSRQEAAKDRYDRAASREETYTKPKIGMSTYTYSDNKTHWLEGEEEDVYDKASDLAYKDHEWASKEMGRDPISKDAFKDLTKKHHYVPTHAKYVRAIKNKADRGDLADELKAAYTQDGKQQTVKEYLAGAIDALESVDREDRRSRSTSSVEAYENHANPKAKPKDEPKDESKAKDGPKGDRTYKEYVNEKRDDGGKPMPKDQWEARYALLKELDTIAQELS